MFSVYFDDSGSGAGDNTLRTYVFIGHKIGRAFFTFRTFGKNSGSGARGNILVLVVVGVDVVFKFNVSRLVGVVCQLNDFFIDDDR